ncbi:MAG: SLC13 family permease [Pseudomonadota bacterium]
MLADFAPFIVTLIVTGLFAAFVLELRSPEISAGIAVALLLLSGIVEIDEVLSVLSSPALVAIASMFILTSSLVRTGIVERVANSAISLAEYNSVLGLMVMLCMTAVLSAFMNNTPVVMLMIPVVVRIARATSQSASKLLIPLSYAAILGGTCTLIGTSTNLLVDSVAQDAGIEPFHIFEVAPLGIVASLVGIATLLIGYRFLPDRTSTSTMVNRGSGKKFIVQAVIEEGSDYVDMAVRSVSTFNQRDRQLIDVLRGDESLRRDLSSVYLRPGDIVVMRSSVAEVLSMAEEGTLTKGPRGQIQQTDARDSTTVEILIAPGAGILNKTLRHLRLRRRYGIYAFALHRGGMNMADRFETTPLEVGDTLLIEGAPEDLARFAEDQKVVNVTEPQERGFRRSRAPLALAICFAVVGGAATGLMPIASLAFIGAIAVLATRCVEIEEAVQSVDWRILGLIFSMLVIGLAMQNTGLVEIIVSFAEPWLMVLSPLAALAAVYVLTTVLTELVTNHAVAVIMAPIAIGIAQALGLDPRPFLVAVMIAASASFITPIGYQTNTLVYNAGGYKFADFLRIGFVIDLTTFIAAMLVIPMVWPLEAV